MSGFVFERVCLVAGFKLAVEQISSHSPSDCSPRLAICYIKTTPCQLWKGLRRESLRGFIRSGLLTYVTCTLTMIKRLSA